MGAISVASSAGFDRLALANHLPYQTRLGGYWDYSPYLDAPGNFSAFTNRVHYTPHLATRRATIDAVSTRVTGAAGAGGILRLGIYLPNSSFLPGKLLAQTTIDSTSTGMKAASIGPVEVEGFFWIAAVPQVATGSFWASFWAYNPISFDNNAVWLGAISGTGDLGSTNYSTASGLLADDPTMVIDLTPRRRIHTVTVRYQ